MASRGNEPATIPVRPHLALGALLVALAALEGVLWAARLANATPHLPLVLGLGALTLVAQGIAYWYLPSFAKRAVVPAGIAAYAGPVLLGLAAAVTTLAIHARLPALLRIATLALGLALVLFPVVLVATVLVGPRWRGGVPFWRSGGHHERGDRAALAAFATSAAWFAASGALLLSGRVSGTAFLVAWLFALALFTAAALAHLAPRSAGVPLARASFLAGIAAANAGTLLLLAPAFTPFSPGLLPTSLLLSGGLGLAASSLAHRRGAKPAGPRWREARIPLAAALAALAVGAFLLVAGLGVRPGWAALAFEAHLVAVLLGMAGLALLALPVLFNQRPDPRFLLPSALATLAGLGFLLAAALLPMARILGGAGLALGVALMLAALWPLRRPRRECPPDA